MIGQFYDWLSAQQERDDAVGNYARLAVRNVRFPRSSRLWVLLKYERNEHRDALKLSHREWRKARRAVAA